MKAYRDLKESERVRCVDLLSVIIDPDIDLIGAAIEEAQQILGINQSQPAKVRGRPRKQHAKLRRGYVAFGVKAKP